MPKLLLPVLFLLCAHACLSQNLSGTWRGFQVSRDNGQYNEYRVTLNVDEKGGNISGTMQLKSPLKGTITSTFTGHIDKKENLLYLEEKSILTEGITNQDAQLCSYVLKVRRNSLKGSGRSRAKGFDHLRLHLERKGDY
jgi:hypothetical protein